MQPDGKWVAHRIEWPDGDSYLGQYEVLLIIMGIITEEWQRNG